MKIRFALTWWRFDKCWKSRDIGHQRNQQVHSIFNWISFYPNYLAWCRLFWCHSGDKISCVGFWKYIGLPSLFLIFIMWGIIEGILLDSSSYLSLKEYKLTVLVLLLIKIKAFCQNFLKTSVNITILLLFVLSALLLTRLRSLTSLFLLFLHLLLHSTIPIPFLLLLSRVLSVITHDRVNEILSLWKLWRLMVRMTFILLFWLNFWTGSCICSTLLSMANYLYFSSVREASTSSAYPEER